MKLTVVRTQFGTDATNGLLFIDGIFESYTIEDQYQAVKVMHETCIPEGTYEIQFRKVGGFHERYAKRYQNSHYGMLHLQDVPNFTYILIHAGNDSNDSSGCILTTSSQNDLDISEAGFGGQSQLAYKRMYDKVAKVLLQGKKVEIEITTIDKLFEGQQDNKAKDHTVLANTVYEKLEEINGNVLIGNAMLKGRLIQ